MIGMSIKYQREPRKILEWEITIDGKEFKGTDPAEFQARVAELNKPGDMVSWSEKIDVKDSNIVTRFGYVKEGA